MPYCEDVSATVVSSHHHRVVARVPCRHVTQRDALLDRLADALREGRHGQEATGVQHGDNLVGAALEGPLDGHQLLLGAQGNRPGKRDVIPDACVLDRPVGEGG